jgi:hypothetical protein
MGLFRNYFLLLFTANRQDNVHTNFYKELKTIPKHFLTIISS